MTKILALACGAVLASAFSLPAVAVEASYTATSASSPDAVWAKIGDFCGISNWGLGLKCALSADGKTRTLTTQDGGVVVEHLDGRDDRARSYSYTILSAGPLPVANYHSKIAVSPAAAGSSITWSGQFDAKGASDADAKKIFDGLYKAGVDDLAK